MTPKWIPGASLNVDPVWAEAMGYELATLEDVEHFTAGQVWTWDTDPERLYDHDPDAVGYVSHVDSDSGTVQVSDGAPPRDPPGINADDPSGPSLLYHLAVAIGAQPPVSECWPR